MKLKNLLELISTSKKWYIYGAGIVAYDISLSLSECHSIVPDGYVVTSKNKNDAFFTDDEIQIIDSFLPDESSLILIATPATYHDSICSNLREKGCKNIIIIDDGLYDEILSEYCKKFTDLELLNDLTIDSEEGSTDTTVYMAVSHHDKNTTDIIKVPGYIRKIQAGKYYTDISLERLADNTFDNISFKNSNYSELTVTYWVWKNTKHEYKGICHYRRFLNVTVDNLSTIKENAIDVILPFPYICRKRCSEQFERYVNENDFSNLLKAVKLTQKEQYDDVVKALQERYIYNHNILLAREEVFNDYCEWLFSILGKAEELCDPDSNRNDRYIGYLGELLTSAYFIINKNKLQIRHTNLIWRK